MFMSEGENVKFTFSIVHVFEKPVIAIDRSKIDNKDFFMFLILVFSYSYGFSVTPFFYGGSKAPLIISFFSRLFFASDQSEILIQKYHIKYLNNVNKMLNI